MFIPKLVVGYLVGLAIGAFWATSIVLAATVSIDFCASVLLFTIALFMILIGFFETH